MNDKLIATIPKNSLEQVRIQVCTFLGNQYIDVRVFYRENEADGECWHPTKKGIRAHCELLPDLIAGLQDAQREIEGGPG